MVLCLARLFLPCETHRGQNLADAALSGGPGGRGWGGAVVDDCTLRVSAEHPNKFGFRVTIRNWVRGAMIVWHFEHNVSLAKCWGPVKTLSHGSPVDESTLSFKLRAFGSKQRSAGRGVRRTDQWGFVLRTPYSGRWKITCILPYSPPPPPPSTKSILAYRGNTSQITSSTTQITTSVGLEQRAPSIRTALLKLVDALGAVLSRPFITSPVNATGSNSMKLRRKRGSRPMPEDSMSGRRSKGKGGGKGRRRRRRKEATERRLAQEDPFLIRSSESQHNRIHSTGNNILH